MVRFFNALAVLILSNTFLFGQNKEANLKLYFSKLVESKQFNGSVLVAEGGKIIYQQGFGYADFDNKIPNTVNTAFSIASISKTINATGILQLAQVKKLKVDDAVKKHLPWFPYDSIQIRHLLSHTSGLPPYNAFFDSLRNQQPERVFTNADFKEGILANPKPLLYKPGERGNYDNINFLVTALIIEKVSGMKYADYINKYVLQPAGMKNTFIMPYPSQYNDKSRIPRAYPYLFPHRFSDSMVKATRVPYIVKYWSAYNFSGFGDYVSSLSDLLLYDKAYYTGKLLKWEIKDEAFTPVKLNNGKTNPGSFGLGWVTVTDSSLGKLVYHAGGATGLSCFLVRNLTKQQTVILYDNIQSNNSMTIGFDVLKILNGVHVPLPRKSLAAVYGREIIKNGSAAAREKLFQLKTDTLNYHLSEDEMNLLGYDLMGGPNNPNPFHFPEVRKYPEARETFKLITELFPGSWNAYDSYGEILATLGEKDRAIEMYKKSIELNPQNEGGKKMLEGLIKGKDLFTSNTSLAQDRPSLEISQLTKEFYIYTTYGDAGNGTMFPANGMYVLTNEGVVLIDSPWDTAQFQPLLDSIWARHQQKVIMCISTHFHEDRTAGLTYYRQANIKTYTTKQTDDISKEKNKPRAEYLIHRDTTFKIGEHNFEVYYPGKGHSPDNIVIWFGKEKILYGGCFVKSTETESIGNLSDADVEEWVMSVKKVQHKFSNPIYVIPGHQGWAGNSALEHTLKILNRHIKGSGR